MTREQLRDALLHLGVAGKVLSVHADLPALGLTADDASWVVEVVIDVVGRNGTILLPTFTYDQTLDERQHVATPSRARLAVPFHAEMPTAEPVAEAFRRQPGVLRSNHPTHSFAALGPLTRELLSTHRDNNPLGPLKKLNVHRGALLLLGSSLEAVPALHLALEGNAFRPFERRVALRVNAAGYRERVVIEWFPSCTRAFGKLEPLLDQEEVRSFRLPTGAIRLIPIRYLLQLAARVLQADPLALFCERVDCKSCTSARQRIALEIRKKAG